MRARRQSRHQSLIPDERSLNREAKREDRLTKTLQDRQRILVGVIGAPHGVRGEVRLKSYTSDPRTIADHPALWSQNGGRTFKIVNARLLKDDMLVVRFDGIADREAAQSLTNLSLFVDRATLPPAEEDEFYHADLIGLRAADEQGEAIGVVVAMQNFGAGDLIEVAPPQGETFYVPFTRTFVPHVDIAGGVLTLAEGALPGDDDAQPDLSRLADR